MASKEICGRFCHFTFSDDEVKREGVESVWEGHKLVKMSRSAPVIENMGLPVTDNRNFDNGYCAVDEEKFGGEVLVNMNTHEVSTQRLIA